MEDGLEDDLDSDELRESLMWAGQRECKRLKHLRKRETHYEPNLHGPLCIVRTASGYGVTSIAYLNCSNVLLVGFSNGVVETRSPESWYAQERLIRHKYAVTCLVEINERYAVSGSRDGTLVVWDLIKSRSIGTFTGHANDCVNDAILLSKGNPFCKIHNKGLSKEDMRAKKKPRGRTRQARDQKKCPYKVELKESIVVSVGNDNCVRFWRVSNQESLRTIVFDTYVECVYELQDGRLVAGDFDGFVNVWDLSTNSDKCRSFLYHGSNVEAVLQLRPELGDDGKEHTITVTASNDCNICFIRDIGTKSSVIIKYHPKAYARSLLQMEDGRVVAGGNAGFKVFDSKGTLLYERFCPEEVEEICKVKPMGFIACGLLNGSIERWKLTENT